MEREGIKIVEIKDALRVNKSLAETGMKKGKGAFSYIMEEKDWITYDSSLNSFGLTFDAVLPKDTEDNSRNFFEDYIKATLSEGKKHDLTAVEFGGPGSSLFKEFNKEFTDTPFKQTIGVCLEDVRSQDQKETDAENNHSVIVGNIMDPKNNELLTKVTQTLGTDKIDLIISRMEGPLNYIHKNLAILDHIIRNWYNLLNENGLMFIQFNYYSTPYNSIENEKTENLIKKWATAIKDRFQEIDIQVGNGVFRLHKKAGAPEKLPPATQLFRE